MPTRPRLVFLLNGAQRQLQHCIEAERGGAAARAATPSLAQAGLLFALSVEDGQTMGQVAQALDLAPSAVSGLIQRMEALGWVARRACPQDARAWRVWLLPQGRGRLPGVRSALARLNARLTDSFTEDELHTVGRWLEHVRQLGRS